MKSHGAVTLKINYNFSKSLVDFLHKDTVQIGTQPVSFPAPLAASARCASHIILRQKFDKLVVSMDKIQRILPS